MKTNCPVVAMAQHMKMSHLLNELKENSKGWEKLTLKMKRDIELYKKGLVV